MQPHEIAKVVNELRDIAVQYRDAQQLRERIAHVVVPLLAAHNAGAQEPIDMLLFCPKCGAQHVDAPEEHDVIVGSGEHRVAVDSVTLWENPPHRSHLCHSCGTIWRPADIPTNGIAKIETRGKADTWDAADQPQPMTDAARDVLSERLRQVDIEGWTPAHDDEHTGCSLAVAAACYALFAAADNSDSADAWLQEWRKTARYLWPYDKEWQKTTTPRRDLVKAGALILAEIERIDRRAEAERGEREGKAS